MNLLSKNVKKYTPKGTLHKEECGLNFLSFAHFTIKKSC